VALVGEQLRHAREALDYSIPDVVGMTNLMTDQVNALEAGDWSAFAAPVYVRGFVRSYAGVLKLDAQALLADLDEEMGQTDRKKGGFAGNAQLRSGFIDGFMLYFSHVKWRAVMPILLLVGLVVGIYFGVDYYRTYSSTDHLDGLGTGLNAEPIITENDLLPLEPDG
jgi:cytoskeletal protein RodZ|tara:strand:+ start:6982 stop:7482 length:501 start_codon:yes stop_codon:yes gene_type:complete